MNFRRQTTNSSESFMNKDNYSGYLLLVSIGNYYNNMIKNMELHSLKQKNQAQCLKYPLTFQRILRNHHSISSSLDSTVKIIFSLPFIEEKLNCSKKIVYKEIITLLPSLKLERIRGSTNLIIIGSWADYIINRPSLLSTLRLNITICKNRLVNLRICIKIYR